MSDLDRIFANNQDSNRMNQVKQIAKSTTEIAMLAVGIHGKAVFNKAAGAVKTPAPGTIFDVKGQEMARKLAADEAARRTKAEVAKTVLKKNSGEPLKKGIKAGYDNLYETGKKRLANAKTLTTKENITWTTTKDAVIKKEVRTAENKLLNGVGNITRLGDLGKVQHTLFNARKGLNSFKSSLHGDANGIINAISEMTLGKPDITHGVVGYANKVLSGTVGPGKSTLKAQEAVAKMTEMENKTNTLVEKNLKILKESGVKDLPAKAVTKKEQEAIMKMKVPDKILKETDWLKNKSEFLSLRQDINGLGSKIVAINRGSFDVAKETENLRIIGEQQEALAEQVKTFVQHDGKLELISNKTTEEIMNKNFLASLDITNVKYAYKMVDDYAVMATRKNILSGELQAQITEGGAQLDYMVGRTTADLLNDTKKMLENSKKDSEDEERSESEIRRLRKA